jgi:mannose-6-phosphate isomerase-like protein (cupin superfamily)
MQRRSFLSLAVAAASTAAYSQSPNTPSSNTPSPLPARSVASGKDRLGETHHFGIASVSFKVVTDDTAGDLFAIEQATHHKGGPPRHLHLNQDEWFYVLEGEFLIEIGDQRLTLHQGDSVLARRKVPHVWAFTGNSGGRVLITFTPAGRMEAFFLHVTKTHTMPPQDKALFQAYGMELTGPPLTV